MSAEFDHEAHHSKLNEYRVAFEAMTPEQHKAMQAILKASVERTGEPPRDSMEAWCLARYRIAGIFPYPNMTPDNEDHMRLPWHLDTLDSDKHDLLRHPHNYHAGLILEYETEDDAIEGEARSAILEVTEFIEGETYGRNTGEVCSRLFALDPAEAIRTLRTERGWTLTDDSPLSHLFEQTDPATILGIIVAAGSDDAEG